MKVILNVLLLFCLTKDLLSQGSTSHDYPVIGKKCPEFQLKNIEYFKRKEAGLKDFAGKLLIIDFFSRGCVSCFASFPKLKYLQEKYKDQVEIVLIGLAHNAESFEKLKPIYEIYRQKYDLQIPVTFDSTIGKTFKIEGVPHVLYIDRNGIVQAVTYEVKEDKLIKFIKGEHFEFEDVSYDKRQQQQNEIDIMMPLQTYNNGGPDTPFIQRSLLSKWDKKTPITVSNDFLNLDIGIMDYVPAVYPEPTQLTGQSLKTIFALAYLGSGSGWSPSNRSMYGVYHQHPIIEVKDSSLFAEENKYNYSLITPPSRNKNKQQIMQNDLENFFGYLAIIETRKMPCLRLISNAKAKQNLITKAKEYKRMASAGGFIGQNVRMTDLISGIDYPSSLGWNGLPLVDETGITGNIDIQFSAVMTDWQDVKKALQPFGLDIIPGIKEMKCLVIKDKPDK